jgi:acyl-CoA synthetase (AMP-forming)/AMP-acid ligase II
VFADGLLHRIPGAMADHAPGTVVLVDGDRRWTAAEFDELVNGLATGLRRHTRPGDRIAVVSDNRAEFVALLYAAPRAGCVLTMGNTRHTTDELVAVLADVRPTLVLASGDHLARLLGRADDLPSIGSWWRLDHGPPPAGAGGLASLVDGTTDPDDWPAATPSDHVWLIHTSGTTSRAKGVVLTHRSLLAAVAATTPARPMGPDDVYLFPFPLFHVAAYNVVHAHVHHRPVVLCARFEAGEVLATIEREQVTQVSLAPTMLTMLLDHPDRPSTDLSSLRRISYGASPMAPDLVRRTIRELPHVGLAQGYGMTELSGNAVFLSPDEHRRAVTDQPELLRAAGRPGPGVRLRIADEAGRALPDDTSGEIMVTGEQVCAGYWERPDAEADAFRHDRDGTRWLRTGDLGTLSSDGVLFVVDRVKDIVITGGENVSSREVEDLLTDHPAVAAAAVVGVPDERWGELVCAVVVWQDRDGVRPSAQELVEWTAGRIAGFKRPRRIVPVDALPTNASGKVDKRALRQLLSA